MSALETIARALFGIDPERAVPIFVLLLARTLPLAWVAPWLGWKGTAMLARIAVAIALAVALTPVAIASAPEVPSQWLVLFLLGMREFLLGAVFAVATSLPLWALGWTGGLIDRLRASPMDSTLGAHEAAGPLGALHAAAGVVLFVSIGGHRLALAAFAETLIEVPVGAGANAADLGAFALGSARLITASLELAVAFAAPAAIAFVVLELVLGLAGRVAPELRVFFDGMPLRAALGIAIACFGLAALVPVVGPLFADSIDAASELVRRLGG